MLYKILPILALLTATLFGASVPRATGAQPGSQLIGETFSQSLCFDNNGTATGYEPQFEIVTPAGIKLTAASFYGNPTISHQETCMANECNVSNPIIGQPSFFSPIDGNESYYILDFPIGAFSTEWPEQCMDLTFELESSGDHVQLGNPLDIKTVGVFSLGETPVDDGNYTYGPEHDLTVIPDVYTLEKSNNATEGERATGEKYPIRATITVDIAKDENLTNLQVVDDLDGGMQFTQMISNAGCTETQLPSTTSPGGTLELDCSSKTGVLGPDLNITYEYYIPEEDENNDSILGGNCQWKPLVNLAHVTAEHDFNNTQTPLPQIDANSSVTAKAITMLKTSRIVKNAPTGGFGPGAEVEYTLSMDVSEFASQSNIIITDILGDGQAYDISKDNNYTLSTGQTGTFDISNINYDGSFTIEFDLSKQLSDDHSITTIAAGTTITVTFRTTINDDYSTGEHIAMGDVVTNHVDLDTTMGDGTTSCPIERSDTSNSVATEQLTKTIYAVNGVHPAPTPYLIHPGDNVTYRLKSVMPVKSFYDFKLLDYLPFPFFRADQLNPGDGPDANSSTNPGRWAPGPDNTYDRPPTLTVDAGQNSLTWTFGEDNTTQRGAVLDLLFTVTATNEPMADALTLANIGGTKYKNAANQDLGTAGLVDVITQEPHISALHLKSIVGSTNTNSNKVMPPNGFDDAMDNVDANDTITYQLDIYNDGNGTAYDVNLSDVYTQGGNIGQGLHNCILLSATDDARILQTIGGAFNGDLNITQVDTGEDFIVQYTCVVDQDAGPGDDIDNTATLKSYASKPGGPNFVNKTLESKAKLELAENTKLTKTLYATSLPSTPGNNLNPGEIAYFEINATLGEGTYFGFNVTDDTCDTPPVFFDSSANVHFNGSNLVVEGTPGTSTGTVSYRCSYQATVNSPKTSNTAKMTATNITPVDSNTVLWTVTPPDPNPSKVMNPSNADAGDLVTVTMDWDSNNTENPSYQCNVRDQLDPLFDWNTINITQVPVGYQCTENASTGIVSCDYNNTTTPCGTGAVVFTVKLKDDITIGGQIVNKIEFKGKTLPSDHNKSTDPDYNGNTDANASATLNLLSPAAPLKIFTKTSEDFTDPGDANLNSTPPLAIGEVVDVNITYGFFEGKTLEVRLDERFLDGGRLVYVPDSMTIMRDDGNLTVADPVINGLLASVPVGSPVVVPDTSLNINDTRVYLFVGDVTNALNSPVSSAKHLKLSFRVKVQNQSDVQSGVLIRDRGRTHFKDSTTGDDRNIQSGVVSGLTYEPLPQISKDVNSSGTVQAGTALRYTIKVCNDETGTGNFVTSGFDWNISDRIPDDILPNGNPTFDTNGTGATVNVTRNGQDINATIDRLDPAECISISYDAVVQQSAQFGQIMTNTAKFETTSLSGTYGSAGNLAGLTAQEPGELNGKRTGSDTGPNDLFGQDTSTVVMGKGIMNKDLLAKQSYYAIGEEAQYRIRIGLPKGETKNFKVFDTLPVGLDFNESKVNVLLGTNVTATNTPPNISQNGQVVTFDFGDLNATAISGLTVEYNVTVENIGTNQDGMLLQNDANVTYNDPNQGGGTITITPVTPAEPVRVGEPNLFIQKRITAGAVKAEAGKTVSWEVVISNDPLNNAHTTAYAVDWTDILPSHLANIQNYALSQSGPDVNLSGQSVQLDTSHLVENNTTLSLPSFDLPVGSTVTVTFDSIVQNDAVAGETQTNETNASYTSIIGADGSVLGGRNSLDCGDDDDNTKLNNYCESATADLIINAGIAIDKRLQTSQVNYTIGQQVTYVMKVSLIEGITPNVVLTDTLPAGLKYVSHSCQDAGGTQMTFDCNLTGTSPVTIDFGNVSNPADGNSTNDYIDVELTALVENVSGNQNGYKPENGDTAGTLVTVKSDANSSAVTEPVVITIVEPDLNVTKTVTPTISGVPSQALGDIVTYTIVLRHSSSSTSDAYDINFTDTLDNGLEYIPGSAIGATVTQTGQTLNFGFPYLAQSESRTISYKARINETVAIGVDLNNSLDTVFGGLPDANGSVDGGRNGTDGIGGALNDYAFHTSAAVTPNDDVLTPLKSIMGVKDNDNDGVVSVGDSLEYNLSVSNTLGYDVGEVNVTDTLDQGLTLMLNSIKVYHNSTLLVDTNTSSTDWTVSGYWYKYTDNNVTIDYNGDTNYFEIYWSETLKTGETFDVTFDAKINNGSVSNVVFGDNTTLDINRSTNAKVLPGTVIYNTFTVDSNRTVPTDSNEVNETVERRAPAPVPPPKAKKFTATDQDFTDPGDTLLENTPPVAIGEVIDIELKVDAFGGIVKEVYMRDNFDSKELVFVPGSMRLIRSSTYVTVSQPDLSNAFGSSTLDIPVDDSLITFDLNNNGFELSLGDVNNSNYAFLTKESLTLTFQLRVNNDEVVQAGNKLSDHGSIVFLDFDYDTNTSSVKENNTSELNVTVVEPNVKVTKTMNPISAEAGDTVLYTLEVCNDGSNDLTSGFDWHITDVLPQELDLESTGYVVNANGTGAVVTIDTNQLPDLDATVDRLDPTECIFIDYNVTVNGIAEFEQDITNTVRVETTSLPGPSQWERTGTGTPPDDLNSSATATLHIDKPGVTKAITGQKPYYPIADTVEYNITLGFTGSARDLTIVDHFPVGLAYVPGSARLKLPVDANVSYNPPQESNNGQDWTFVIGDLNISTAGNLHLELNATVEDIASNIDGVQLTNELSMIFTNPNTGESTAIPAVSPAITIGEPDLNVVKTITTDLSVPKSAGDVISYEVKITNSGTTTAYYVEWEDKVPVHTGEISNPHLVVHAGTAFETNTTVPITDANFTISTVDEPDDKIELVPFDLSLGATLVITFDTIIQPNVIPAETLTNITGATAQSTVFGGRKHNGGINAGNYAAVDSISFSINQLPEAIDDCTPPLKVTQYAPTPGDLGANDILGDGTKAEHTWRLITPPSNGTVVVNKDGTYVYTPDANYNGPDGFIYEIEDSNGDRDRAKVCIDVDCASTQTSDGGDALNTAGMLLMLMFTAMIGLYFVRREENRGGLDHE